MENKSDSKNQTLTIDDIINEIKEKSADGDYIYRGERKSCYEKVSSALYREYSKHINMNRISNFDLIYAQKEMLKIVKNHIGESPVGPLEYFADVTGVNKLPNRSFTPTNMVERVRMANAIEKVREIIPITPLATFSYETKRSGKHWWGMLSAFPLIPPLRHLTKPTRETIRKCKIIC